MSTNAIIKIEGFPYAKVYKHFDGYPNGTLPWLEKFNKDFAEKRGNDASYKFAQLLRDSVRSEEEFDLGNSRYTGWGVIKADPSHQYEYEYTLHEDGRVTYECN